MTHVADVVIDSTKVSADLTDFVVYVDLSDLPASFWSTVANGGGDIRCYKSDGTTELAREVVSCDTATDTGELHIKFAGTLSSSVDTTIQIHADGTSSDYAVTATYGRNAVWSDYDCVMHMAGNATDSSGNYTPSVNGATSLSKGYDFDGVNDYIDIGALVSNQTDSMLISLDWEPDDSAPSVQQGVLSSYSNSGRNFEIHQHESGAFTAEHRAIFGNSGGSGYGGDIKDTGSGIIVANTRYRTGLRRDGGSITLKLYRDGAAVGTASGTTPSNSTSTPDLYLGARPWSPIDTFFDGTIYGFRMRSDAGAFISSDSAWMLAEYNNQSSPSTFYAASAVSGGTTITGSGVVQNLGQQFATQVAAIRHTGGITFRRVDSVNANSIWRHDQIHLLRGCG